MNIHKAKPVYYVTARPEAYEFWGEVEHDNARELARLIAERAGKRFPRVEFRVDEEWHIHPEGMESIAVYIDDHLQSWVTHASARSQAQV